MPRFLLILTIVASAHAQELGPVEAGPQQPKPDENDVHWHRTAKDIAAVYRLWGRVDDEARWAPFLCRAPDPGAARLSKAAKDTPHGRKLYTLFAKDPKSFGYPPTHAGMMIRSDLTKSQRDALTRLKPVPQVIVKESWTPEKTTRPADPRRGRSASWGKSGVRPVQKGDHWYRGKDKGPLFLMFQPGKTRKPTDKGWIYAVVDEKGAVTGAGRMQSCMNCHTKRGDRLFGLPKTPK